MSGAIAQPPGPADVGLLAALPIEIAPFLERLRDVRKYAARRHAVVEGALHGRIVALVVTGPGQQAAAAGASVLLAGHRPRLLISAGFAGALDSSHARNDIVLPERIQNEAGESLKIDTRPNLAGATGRLLTVDRIVRTAAEKAHIHQATGATLVDMESFAVARLASERAVPFLGIRVVSDDAQTDLPPELLTLVGPTGSYRIGAAVGAILKQPARLGAMLKLREHAQTAAGHLAKALAELIARLP